MKNYLILLCAICLAINVNAQKKETRKLDNFTSIKVSGGISVELLKGKPSADIEVIKGELDELVTEVKRGVLHIKFDKKGMFNWSSGNRKAHMKVRGDLNLESIDASAGSYIGSEETIESKEIDIDASSGGKIELAIDCYNASCNASSGGHLRLNGVAESLAVDASSGGHYNGKNLKSESVDVDASSGGSASVWATKSIKANASSGGSVKYKGDPRSKDIDVGKYSGGSVRKM